MIHSPTHHRFFSSSHGYFRTVTTQHHHPRHSARPTAARPDGAAQTVGLIGGPHGLGSHPPCWYEWRSQWHDDLSIAPMTRYTQKSRRTLVSFLPVLPVPRVRRRSPMPDPPCHRQHVAGQPFNQSMIHPKYPPPKDDHRPMHGELCRAVGGAPARPIMGCACAPLARF